jgi:hypothetical protein
VAASRVAESRLNEHLDAGPAEAVACADQVVPRHTLHAPRDRGRHAGFADWHSAANPHEKLSDMNGWMASTASTTFSHVT